MEGTEAISANAVQAERFGDLGALQRRLVGATSTAELLARACVEAARACGFERGAVLALDEGRLTSAGTDKIDDPACDALRRQSLANPVVLEPGSGEAELMRRAAGSLRGSPGDGGAVAGALELGEYVLAPIVPESQALALLVVDRAEPAVTDADEATVQLFAHLLGGAVERVVLRLRIRELSTEMRYLTASAHALMNEAMEAPISLSSDYGHGPVFTTAGQHAAMPNALADLLSEREREIATLMVGGRSNREIGEALHLSPDTVKAHVARLVRKLGASNRVEAVARYVTMLQSPE